MPSPKDEEGRGVTPGLTRLRNAVDLAEESLGKVADLRVLKQTTRDLADYYLERHGIEELNPDSQTTAFYLAITRRNQMLALKKLEERLHRMVLEGEAEDLADAYMRTTLSGRLREVHKEINRLHNLAIQLVSDLDETRPE